MDVLKIHVTHIVNAYTARKCLLWSVLLHCVFEFPLYAQHSAELQPK